jgi:hypothetical protein
MFDALTFLNLGAEFGGAFLDLPVQLRNPQSRRRQDASQRAHDDEQSLQRPPRRARQHFEIGGGA